jgi:hypothetical protein
MTNSKSTDFLPFGWKRTTDDTGPDWKSQADGYYLCDYPITYEMIRKHFKDLNEQRYRKNA